MHSDYQIYIQKRGRSHQAHSHKDVKECLQGGIVERLCRSVFLPLNGCVSPPVEIGGVIYEHRRYIEHTARLLPQYAQGDFDEILIKIFQKVSLISEYKEIQKNVNISLDISIPICNNSYTTFVTYGSKKECPPLCRPKQK